MNNSFLLTTMLPFTSSLLVLAARLQLGVSDSLPVKEDASTANYPEGIKRLSIAKSRTGMVRIRQALILANTRRATVWRQITMLTPTTFHCSVIAGTNFLMVSNSIWYHLTGTINNAYCADTEVATCSTSTTRQVVLSDSYQRC